MIPSKSFLICTLIFSISFLNAQSQTNKEFEQYANKQNDLMVKAYEQKDAKVYNVLLDDFLPKYEKLSKEDKSNFRSYYTNSFYNLSCLYSILDEKSKALEYLEKSIKAGNFNYGHMKIDSDLDNIRNEEKFKTLLEPLRETNDYLYIIKKAGKYNLDEKGDLSRFTYQSADNPNLVSLRKTFKLDSIAGGGNEVSKILNMLHWIHNLVPHDGWHGNPAVMNAMNMITVCKSEKRGLNCRGLATVLNECYLSMGIKSRFITCLPKDSLGIDPDCHVINMVYSNQYKKWLWIDPTFDAYVMNEKGELLSIEEVRDRLITDKPLILNPDANWNHKTSQTKEDYLYNYMAKNTYMFECLLNSEYDAETGKDGKEITYLELIPLDYFKKSLDKSVITSKIRNATLTIYKTNNPASFWQVP